MNLWDKTYSKEKNRKRWNKRAKGYSQLTSKMPSFDYGWVLRDIENLEDARVLDIGCGTGRHSLEFAKRVKNLVGIDLAENMIHLAREEAERKGIGNAEFINLAWEDADLKSLGWENEFDLVFANFTPSIHSQQTLLKMCQASKNACYIGHHVDRYSSLENEVNEKFNLPSDKTFRRLLAAYMNWLILNGYSPSLSYEERTEERNIPEEDIKDLAKKFETNADVEGFIRGKLEGGFVPNTVYRLTSKIYWRV